MFKKPNITGILRRNTLRWFGHVQRMEENRIPKKFYTRAVQWKTGKVVLKIACKTDVVCRVYEGGDLQLPIDGVGTPATRIGTWETVRQDGGALATVHQARAAKCCEIFV